MDEDPVVLNIGNGFGISFYASSQEILEVTVRYRKKDKTAIYGGEHHWQSLVDQEFPQKANL